MNQVQKDILSLLALELDVNQVKMEETKGPPKLDYMCKVHYLRRAIDSFKASLSVMGELYGSAAPTFKEDLPIPVQRG